MINPLFCKRDPAQQYRDMIIKESKEQLLTVQDGVRCLLSLCEAAEQSDLAKKLADLVERSDEIHGTKSHDIFALQYDAFVRDYKSLLPSVNAALSKQLRSNNKKG